jgi:hypothetical protein
MKTGPPHQVNIEVTDKGILYLKFTPKLELPPYML